ncbi:ras-related C3 botulinum toxin substrate 2-like isoform X2 [Hydractinia symbiolongicarpus]|uniref:ras-related C3 botulinum toxin substrate 2-like isoform X2 n=1 Tax=Hydractinia symbiolongicarpus TaxID=13093 RepID=UPI00254A2F53|nr:ras-related C3 botulinum toxin substrate 2-like isoform X2 [Hydractinia symbiolongicarpus]
MPRRITCVAVGDTGVGKTSLLFAFVTKTFRTRYIPAVCDIDPLDVKLDDIKESVSIDVMEALGDDGSEDNELRRPICDPKTNFDVLTLRSYSASLNWTCF